MLSSTANVSSVGNVPQRHPSNRHRKQGKSMGKFAEAAAQHDPNKRGDGYCVTGRWVAENLDDDDLAEFVRLANHHKWELIIRLSDHVLRAQSLSNHVHGGCACIDGQAAKGCCTHNKVER